METTEVNSHPGYHYRKGISQGEVLMELSEVQTLQHKGSKP